MDPCILCDSHQFVIDVRMSCLAMIEFNSSLEMDNLNNSLVMNVEAL